MRHSLSINYSMEFTMRQVIKLFFFLVQCEAEKPRCFQTRLSLSKNKYTGQVYFGGSPDRRAAFLWPEGVSGPRVRNLGVFIPDMKIS